MIPLVHLSECPEPAAYWPDERVLGCSLPGLQDDPTATCWQAADPMRMAAYIDSFPRFGVMSCPSASYRMF